ncbi:F0F1 ATP synthase subunit A [Rhizosphaericola mali]|uniref:ATP synthase subunit a n=1 Tax=Rhizosphaericola mali TaxID=2545455 RepID=A0A5P2G7Q3_9BACT|nr:F0F1 ATP synthase subunit A [Rhizosphaericola mali]QES89800.1 F0F1 ATP synthase subunit A [Rhizosphaericola mali]
MTSKGLKRLLVLVFTVFSVFHLNLVNAQEKQESKEKEAYNAGKSIINHVLDAHQFHILSFGKAHFGLPLPIILFSPEKGLVVFSASHIEEGETYKGFKFSDEEGSSLVGAHEDGSVDSTIVVYSSLMSFSKPLPTGVTTKYYDFSVTKGAAQLIFASVLLIVIMLSVAKKYKKTGANKAPSGFQNAVEPVITFVRDDVAKTYLGHNYERYMPFLLTVFFFILINNLLGLIPGSANVSGNIAFTFVLAIIAFIVIVFSTNGKFWGHVFWFPGVPVPVKILMIPVELLGMVIRPAALMIRLFANMTAGHIVILSFISLIFIFGQMSPVAGYGFSPVSILFVIFMDCVELLVAFIQAFIFTNLTAVFISQSIVEDHH